MAEITVEMVTTRLAGRRELGPSRSICSARVCANAWSDGGDNDRREGLENESSVRLSVLDPPFFTAAGRRW